MRTVVSTSEVAHLWAHQLQSEAYSAGSKNFYFKGESIYSYGSHFEVGRIVKNGKGQKAYILNDHSYSATTVKHQWDARYAIPGGATIFYAYTGKTAYYHSCYSITTDTGEAVSKWMGELFEEIKRFHKAQTNPLGLLAINALSQMKEWRMFWSVTKKKYGTAIKSALKSREISGDAAKSIESILMDCIFNDTTVALPPVAGEIYDVIYGKGSYEAKSRKVAEKAEMVRQEKERQAREWRERYEEEKRIAALSDEERLEKWHNNETITWRPSTQFSTEKGWHSALRASKDGKVVETSQGIRVGLVEGQRMWRMFKIYHDKLEEFGVDLCTDVNGHKWRCSSYKDDIFNIGCHSIPYSEAERVALQLGWA